MRSPGFAPSVPRITSVGSSRNRDFHSKELKKIHLEIFALFIITKWMSCRLSRHYEPSNPSPRLQPAQGRTFPAEAQATLLQLPVRAMASPPSEGPGKVAYDRAWGCTVAPLAISLSGSEHQS